MQVIALFRLKSPGEKNYEIAFPHTMKQLTELDYEITTDRAVIQLIYDHVIVDPSVPISVIDF